MTVLETVLSVVCTILLGANVALFVGGFKVEVRTEQHTVVQTVQVAENNNLNIINNRLLAIISNAEGKTNYSMMLPEYPRSYTNISSNYVSNYNYTTNYLFNYFLHSNLTK